MSSSSKNKKFSMHNFGASMFWYWLMYIVVTIIGILHTVFNIYVLKMKPMDEHSMAEAYERTKPFHPFYIIVLFSIAGWFYMRSFATPSWPEAFITGGLWAGITIVFDFFAWVIIKHSWSLSAREFYIDYQRYFVQRAQIANVRMSR